VPRITKAGSAFLIAMVLAVGSLFLVIRLAPPCGGKYRFTLGGSKYLFFECDGPAALTTNARIDAAPYRAFQSEFRVTDKANETFDAVLSKFIDELRLATLMAPPDKRAQATDSLVEHYAQVRSQYLSNLEVTQSRGQTETINGSGNKRATISITCPIGMEVAPNSKSMGGVGGCYGGPPDTSTTVYGVVSQTGDGKSDCTLSVRCRYPRHLLAEMVAAERAQLSNRVIAP